MGTWCKRLQIAAPCVQENALVFTSQWGAAVRLWPCECQPPRFQVVCTTSPLLIAHHFLMLLFVAADMLILKQGANIPTGVSSSQGDIRCPSTTSVAQQILVAYTPTGGITGLMVACGELGAKDQYCNANSMLGGVVVGGSAASDLSPTGYTGVVVNWVTNITLLGLVRNDGTIRQFGAAATGNRSAMTCPPGMLVAAVLSTVVATSSCTSNLWQLGLLCRRGEPACLLLQAFFQQHAVLPDERRFP